MCSSDLLELAREIEVPASVLLKDAAAEVAEQALKSTTELQMKVTAEAENMLLAPGSEAMSGTSSTQPLIHIESDSTSSQSKSSSSSSTDMDDIPISILRKGQSPSSKLHKKPSKPVSPFKPMEPPLELG